jgi:YD repeat-containing protein
LLASVPNPHTVYEYDLDRHLKTETRPDGAVLSYSYDSAGRLFTITTPSGTVTNTYFSPTPCTGCAPGKLAQLTGLDGVNLAFTYDGLLPSRTTWSGPVSGAFARTYNNDFRFITEAITPGVGSSASTFFGYDRDGLTVCASPSSCNPASSDAMTLVYHPSHGLLTSDKLGNLNESLTYNAFGELATTSATSGTTAILGEVYDSTSFPRDPLGRVQRKVETIQGSATTFDYFYDERGQLIGVTQNGAQTAAYAYDPNGNRLSATSPSGTIGATYDDQDRLHLYGQRRSPDQDGHHDRRQHSLPI